MPAAMLRTLRRSRGLAGSFYAASSRWAARRSALGTIYLALVGTVVIMVRDGDVAECAG
jgi:hypothetical protein